MIDLSRVLDAASAAIGSSSGGESTGGGSFLDALIRAGVDPTTLEGLSQNQVIQVLAEHGLDLGTLTSAQLSDMLSQLRGTDNTLSSVASEFFQGRL